MMGRQQCTLLATGTVCRANGRLCGLKQDVRQHRRALLGATAKHSEALSQD
jgi:hypothetical protein